MTWNFVLICALASVFFGVLFGRLFAWWGEVRDEEQAMANANIRARFDANRYDALVVEEPYVPNPRRAPFYDWQQAE